MQFYTSKKNFDDQAKFWSIKKGMQIESIAEFESRTDAVTGNALTFSQMKEQPSSPLIR